MPIYEYKCTQCNHQFDIWQEVGAAPPECPQCGNAVKKVFHPVSVHYKGSGFYITDSRPKSDGKADKKSETKADEKSSETKPAASATAKAETTKAETTATPSGSSNSSGGDKAIK